MALLDVKELSVHFGDEKAPFKAVDRISYQVNQGEVLGIVGESGSGKSVLTKTFTGMLEDNGRIAQGSIKYRGQELTDLKSNKRLGKYSWI